MFKVRQTEEMINKTFRMPLSLLEELNKVAEKEKGSTSSVANVSFRKLIICYSLRSIYFHRLHHYYEIVRLLKRHIAF